MELKGAMTKNTYNQMATATASEFIWQIKRHKTDRRWTSAVIMQQRRAEKIGYLSGTTLRFLFHEHTIKFKRL